MAPQEFWNQGAHAAGVRAFHSVRERIEFLEGKQPYTRRFAEAVPVTARVRRPLPFRFIGLHQCHKVPQGAETSQR